MSWISYHISPTWMQPWEKGKVFCDEATFWSPAVCLLISPMTCSQKILCLCHFLRWNSREWNRKVSFPKDGDYEGDFAAYRSRVIGWTNSSDGKRLGNPLPEWRPPPWVEVVSGVRRARWCGHLNGQVPYDMTSRDLTWSNPPPRMHDITLLGSQFPVSQTFHFGHLLSWGFSG